MLITGVIGIHVLTWTAILIVKMMLKAGIYGQINLIFSISRVELILDPIEDIVGRQTRYRSHICDGPRETENCPDCLDTRKCDLNICPTWAQWGEWSGCSQTCSLVAGQQGKRFRTRQCSGVNGQGYLVVDGTEQNCECSEPNNPNRFYEEQVCGTDPCPKLLTQDPEDPFCSGWFSN